MEPTIIDDFIPIAYQDSILGMLTGHEFPWNIHPYSVSRAPITDYYTDVPTKDHIQFRHMFMEDDVSHSKFCEYMKPLTMCFENIYGSIETRQRIKANLLMKQDGPHLQHPHSDIGGVGTNSKTLLYYVNDSDGDTVLYNEYYYESTIGLLTRQQTISPKKGRAVIFDSHQIHSACCPAISDYRIVINMILS